MKYYYFLLVLILLSCCSTSKRCVIEHRSIEYHNLQSNKTITYVEYSITNHTKEVYYTWIDFSYSSNDIIIAAKKYFYSYIGDFNLAALLFDNVNVPDFTPLLGISFLKEIKPGDSFYYLVRSDNDKCKGFDKIIIFASESELKSIGITPIVNRNILFPDRYVIVP